MNYSAIKFKLNIERISDTNEQISKLVNIDPCHKYKHWIGSFSYHSNIIGTC